MPAFFKSVRNFLLLSSLAIALPATAQFPGLPKTPAPATAPTEETPEQTQTRLQNWLKDARASLARLEEPNAEAQLPEGIAPAALADRRRDLDQTVRTINRTISLLGDIPNAKNTTKEAEAANANWNGFDEKPPYSILKLDDLINQRDAAKEKEATYKSSQSIFNKSFDGIDRETNGIDDALREANEAASKTDASEAARWKLDAAKAKSRLLSVRAFFVRTNLQLIQAQASASAAQLSLLERQIGEVQKNAVLSDDDLTTIQKASDERRSGLRNEIKAIQLRLKDASSGRIRAKSTFDDLTAANPPASPADLGLAAARLSAAEVRVDTLQFISDNLESFESLEGLVPLAYESRKTLIDSKIPADRKAALESLHSLLNRLNAWEIVSANELAAVNADLAAQDSNASVIPPDDPRLPALADQRKALWEKQGFLQRIAQTVIAHRKNVSRWIGQFESQGKGEWYSEVSRSGLSLWDMVKKVWGFEVTKVETITYSAGVPRSETRSVSLGIIISAITFFIIAYMISSRISRRLQNIVVRRGRIAEAQANTLRNWLMIVVGVALAITTLQFLRIPLTVFAFFGGALAIGLGFGTQTLIKNFISGIIVLFERKIRVGDVVEIDATTSGKVVEINTRSSVLRNAEGKETLVPNSLFLESRVTNLTLSNRRVRRTIRVGVAYGSPPAQVTSVLKECIERHGLILKDPAPVVTLEDFGSDALIFAMFYWVEINSKTDSSVVASDVRIMVEKRFAETGIEFPKSQRDQNLMASAPLQIELVGPAKPEPWPPKKSIP